jgi:RHS repeat-associated protein
MDTVIGIDVHAVTPIPGIPIHPYVGPIYLWTDPAFPKSNVFINGMPAMTVGSMGYSVHVPQGIPVNPPNLPYWKRYLSNVAMATVLMALTTLANIAIAGISALVPKPPAAEAFLKDVTGIDTSSRAATWESVKGAFASLTQWMTWAKLLMPPLPYPGAQGSVAVGSPNVTVNGGPLGFVAPLVATSCSDIPVVPNAMTLGFSNVLVGVTFADLLRGIAVSAAQQAVSAGVGAAQRRMRQRNNNNCGRPGEPIDPVTGAAETEWVDYEAHDAPTWRLERAHSTVWAAEDGPFGFGARASFQRELMLLEGGNVVYQDERKRSFPFSPNGGSAYLPFAGYTLERHGPDRFILRHPTHGALGFQSDPANSGRARFVALRRGGVHHAFRYDEDGRLASVRQTAAAPGHRVVDTIFSYDGAGHVVEVQRGDADQVPQTVARYTYDARGCLAAWFDPAGSRTTFVHDHAHRIRTITDRRGYSFHYHYDRRNRCIESYGEDGLWHVRLRYGLDRTFVTEGDGGLWVYVFDENGTICEVIDPYGGCMRRDVGADGRIVAETDAGGRRMVWLHDEHGHHHSRLDEWGLLWPTKDEAPRLRNPLAHTVAHTALAREWGAPASQPKPTAILPVPANVATLIVEHFALRLGAQGEARDALGRVVSRTDDAGRTERFGYDAAGNAVQRVDADSSVWAYQRTSWNLLGAERDPTGNITRYRYTGRQYVSAVIDGAGNETRYEYDRKDRVERYVLRGRVQDVYRYDHGDRVLERRDGADHLLVRYEVGENGLHSLRELASGEVHHFGYDARGRFIEASTNRHKVTLAYSADRRAADLRDGKGIVHTRSGGGRVSSVYLGRFVVEQEALPSGGFRLHAPDGSEHVVLRDERGRWLRVLGNGTREASVYDGDGRCVERIRWNERLHAEPRWTTYAYSGTGELRAVQDSRGSSCRWDYDAAHRLIGDTGTDQPARRYGHDAAGNLTLGPKTIALELAPGNLLLHAGGERLVYDDRGRLAERIDGGGRVTRYRYDSLDLLVEVGWSDRDELWQAERDGLCRLIAAGCGGRCTQFHWDGDRLAAEVAPDGRVRLYIYPAPDTFLPVLFIDYDSIDAAPPSGRAFYPFHDQIGLPQYIEDAAGRTVWRAAATDAYGLIDVAADSAIDYRLRFPGHLLVSETGLHENRFRSYDPALGRYLQPDPSGQRGGINLYAYSENPLANVDLLGLHDDGHAPNNSHAGDGNDANGPPGGRPPGPGDGPAARPGWPPPRTAKAQRECQHVIDTMASMGWGKKRNPVVDVLTHENDTVSVGFSGEDSKSNREKAADLEERLNRGNPNRPYRVARTSTVPGIVQVPPGNEPNLCAEPHAATAAHDNPSPIDGHDTRWRGKAENPHRFKGENADPTPVDPSQMDPCKTCADPQNSQAYGDYANAGAARPPEE